MASSHKHVYQKMLTIRAGEMAQKLRSLAVLTEAPSAVPSTPTAAQNHLYLQFQRLLCPLLASTDTRHAHGTQACT